MSSSSWSAWSSTTSRPTRSRCRAGTPWSGSSATRSRPSTSSSPRSGWSWWPTPARRTGNRDHHAYVLRSGAARFVIKGAYDPDSTLADHHRAHGDGIVDIALAVPDVDRCVAHAPRPGRDRAGAAARRQRRARHGPAGRDRRLRRHRHTLVDRSRYDGPYLPGYVRGPHPHPPGGRAAADIPGDRPRGRQRRARRRWTSGSTSTTGSWGSPTWPSSSATTSPPTTPP